jgi:hypothetical protein
METALHQIEQTGWMYPDLLISDFCLEAGLICLLSAGLILRFMILAITDILQANGMRSHLFLLITATLLISAFAPANRSDSPKKSSIKYSAGLFNGKFGSKDLYTGKPYTTRTCILWICVNHQEYPYWDDVERVFNYWGTKFSIESVHRRSTHRYSTIGLRLFAGGLQSPEKISPVRNIDASRDFIILLNPYFYSDYKYSGFGAGLSIGKIPVRSAQYSDVGLSYNENKTANLTLSFSFRLLRRDSFFLYGKFNDMDSETFPQIHYQFGFGFGFQRLNQYGVIRAGISDGGLYLEPDIPVTNHLSLYGRFKLPGHSQDYRTPQTHLSIGVRYTR